MAAVSIHSDFEAQENKVYCFHFVPIYLPWGMGPDQKILVFWMLNFKPAFPFSSFTFIKRLFSSSLLSAIRMVSSTYLRPLPTAFIFSFTVFLVATGLHPLSMLQSYPSPINSLKAARAHPSTNQAWALLRAPLGFWSPCFWSWSSFCLNFPFLSPYLLTGLLDT